MKTKIVITGGNGDIAQAIAALLKKKYDVYTPDKIELDVTSLYNVKYYMKKIKPHILINVAGYIYPQAIKEINIEELYKHMNINLIGAIICSKYAIINGCNMIINIGSTAGCKGKANWSAYCISKAGLIMLSQCLKEEGLFSITLSIGRTNTKMRKKLFAVEDDSLLMQPKDIAKRIKTWIDSDFDFWNYINGKNIKMYKKDGKICIEEVC